MPYRPLIAVTKLDKHLARQARQAKKADRADARREAKAERIARGEKGAPIEWPQPPIPAGVANSLGAAR
jgi:hypothetical protein